MSNTVKVKVVNLQGKEIIGYSTILPKNGNWASTVIKEYKRAVEKELGYRVKVSKV